MTLALPDFNHRRTRLALAGINGLPFGDNTGTRSMVINLTSKLLVPLTTTNRMSSLKAPKQVGLHGTQTGEAFGGVYQLMARWSIQRLRCQSCPRQSLT